MNSALYKQYDSRWGSKPYPTKSSSFAGNGCGCCACTHVLIEQDRFKDYTPEPFRKWMVDQGFAYVNQGTSWEGIRKTLEYFGHKVIHIGINDPMSKAWAELNKGNRIGVILFKGGRAPNGMVWTAGGHYVAFTDYYVGKDGRHYFYTKDSGGRDNDSVKHGYYSYENSMKGLVYQMWIVEKIGTTPTPTPAPTPTPPTPTPTPSGKIAEDGKFGPESIKALQSITGTPITGAIGGQLSSLRKYHPGFSSGINYGNGGSACIKVLQRNLGFKDCDGQFGPNTIKALQRFLGLSNPDGYFGPNTALAWQKWINNALSGAAPTPAPSPTPSIIKGMDISTWQGKCSVSDFKKAKADGIDFVILRVGFTGSGSKQPTLDNCFVNNYPNAQAAGLKIGYYYYSLATNAAMAKKEAEYVLSQIKGKQCDYPVYIDVEDSVQSKASKSALAEVCNTFCNTITAAGYKAGVYASTSWFNSKIGTITAPHTKWVAQYYKECQYKGAYDMWQYTSSGTVAGIGDNIDLNYYYVK